jgi:hypothetical protein
MWIMLSDAFFSIVSKNCGPDELMVRARRKGDIEKVFPGAKVKKSTTSDYLYRTVVPRKDVALALANAVDDIDYPNFKDSVEDDWLHYAYLKVWLAMAELRHAPPYTPASKYIAGQT